MRTVFAQVHLSHGACRVVSTPIHPPWPALVQDLLSLDPKTYEASKQYPRSLACPAKTGRMTSSMILQWSWDHVGKPCQQLLILTDASLESRRFRKIQQGLSFQASRHKSSLGVLGRLLCYKGQSHRCQIQYWDQVDASIIVTSSC